jgi:hypothetical protein
VPENLYTSKESTEKCELNILQTLELGARLVGIVCILIPEINIEMSINHNPGG